VVASRLMKATVLSIMLWLPITIPVALLLRWFAG
jgi:hypothetical protein